MSLGLQKNGLINRENIEIQIYQTKAFYHFIDTVLIDECTSEHQKRSLLATIFEIKIYTKKQQAEIVFSSDCKSIDLEHIKRLFGQISHRNGFYGYKNKRPVISLEFKELNTIIIKHHQLSYLNLNQHNPFFFQSLDVIQFFVHKNPKFNKDEIIFSLHLDWLIVYSDDEWMTHFIHQYLDKGQFNISKMNFILLSQADVAKILNAIHEKNDNPNLPYRAYYDPSYRKQLCQSLNTLPLVYHYQFNIYEQRRSFIVTCSHPKGIDLLKTLKIADQESKELKVSYQTAQQCVQAYQQNPQQFTDKIHSELTKVTTDVKDVIERLIRTIDPALTASIQFHENGILADINIIFDRPPTRQTKQGLAEYSSAIYFTHDKNTNRVVMFLPRKEAESLLIAYTKHPTLFDDLTDLREQLTVNIYLKQAPSGQVNYTSLVNNSSLNQQLKLWIKYTEGISEAVIFEGKGAGHERPFSITAESAQSILKLKDKSIWVELLENYLQNITQQKFSLTFDDEGKRLILTHHNRAMIEWLDNISPYLIKENRSNKKIDLDFKDTQVLEYLVNYFQPSGTLLSNLKTLFSTKEPYLIIRTRKLPTRPLKIFLKQLVKQAKQEELKAQIPHSVLVDCSKLRIQDLFFILDNIRCGLSSLKDILVNPPKYRDDTLSTLLEQLLDPETYEKQLEKKKDIKAYYKFLIFKLMDLYDRNEALNCIQNSTLHTSSSQLIFEQVDKFTAHKIISICKQYCLPVHKRITHNDSQIVVNLLKPRSQVLCSSKHEIKGKKNIDHLKAMMANILHDLLHQVEITFDEQGHILLEGPEKCIKMLYKRLESELLITSTMLIHINTTMLYLRADTLDYCSKYTGPLLQNLADDKADVEHSHEYEIEHKHDKVPEQKVHPIDDEHMVLRVELEKLNKDFSFKFKYDQTNHVLEIMSAQQEHEQLALFIQLFFPKDEIPDIYRLENNQTEPIWLTTLFVSELTLSIHSDYTIKRDYFNSLRDAREIENYLNFKLEPKKETCILVPQANNKILLLASPQVTNIVIETLDSVIAKELNKNMLMLTPDEIEHIKRNDFKDFDEKLTQGIDKLDSREPIGNNETIVLLCRHVTQQLKSFYPYDYQLTPSSSEKSKMRFSANEGARIAIFGVSCRVNLFNQLNQLAGKIHTFWINPKNALMNKDEFLSLAFIISHEVEAIEEKLRSLNDNYKQYLRLSLADTGGQIICEALKDNRNAPFKRIMSEFRRRNIPLEHNPPQHFSVSINHIEALREALTADVFNTADENNQQYCMLWDISSDIEPKPNKMSFDSKSDNKHTRRPSLAVTIPSTLLYDSITTPKPHAGRTAQTKFFSPQHKRSRRHSIMAPKSVPHKSNR